MAKRSDNKSDGFEWVKAEEVEPSTVHLTLLRDIVLKVKGPVTGDEYVFNGAGSSVEVDNEDADILIQKRRKHCSDCPGIRRGQPLFELTQN